MNELGLVQAVDRLGQGVVVAVALAAHRRLDTGFGQAFAVPNRHVLPEFKQSCSREMSTPDYFSPHSDGVNFPTL